MMGCMQSTAVRVIDDNEREMEIQRIKEEWGMSDPVRVHQSEVSAGGMCS